MGVTLDETILLLTQMVNYWEARTQTEYHDFKQHDLYCRYMNACAEAVVRLEETKREEDDLK